VQKQRGKKMNFANIPGLNLTNIEMEERLLIYDAWGTPTGISTRSIAHTQGFIHASVHGFGYTDLINGKRYVLIQKRSKTKKINPGKLDYMYAGHMSLSEESFNLPLSVLTGSEFIKQSFIKEGNEELKINMNNKAPVNDVTTPIGSSNGFNATLAAKSASIKNAAPPSTQAGSRRL